MGRTAKVGDDYLLPVKAKLIVPFDNFRIVDRKRVRVTPENIDHIQRYFDSGDFVYTPLRD